MAALAAPAMSCCLSLTTVSCKEARDDDVAREIATPKFSFKSASADALRDVDASMYINLIIVHCKMLSALRRA